MAAELLSDSAGAPGGKPAEAAPSLEVLDLSKTYNENTVLRGVGLTVMPGQIHALLGANGSGKSTLVKCVTGVVSPDPGATISICGRAMEHGFSPGRADEVGVRVVHQDAPLVDALPVAESVALHRGYPLRGGVFTSGRRLREQAQEIFNRVGVHVDPATPAALLSAAERAIVMLALALADMGGAARVVVLDEPTASLPADEADHFLSVAQEAARLGVGVLLVTHRLIEVSQRCDVVTVLRDGTVVANGPASEFDEARMLAEIVGPERDLSDASGARTKLAVKRFAPAPRDSDNADAPALSAQGISGGGVHDVSLRIAPGEVLGIAGIVGSRAESVGRLAAGLARLEAGELEIGGRSMGRRYGAMQAARHGVAFVPGDRLREGGIPSLTVGANIALPALGDYFRRRADARADFAAVVESFRVHPPDVRRVFGTLSGGNQQKVIIGKWALTRPRLFVLEDPAAGVDPGAREDIYAVLKGLQESGTAILVTSSEPEQLVRLADRVVVVKEGRIVEHLDRQHVTVTDITRAVL